MADVLFIVGEEQFWSHSAILILASPVMATILESNSFNEGFQSINVQDIDPQTFRLLLDYLHSGELPEMDESTAESVLAAASKYQIGHLTAICEDVLSECIDLSNVVHYLVLSYLNKAINLFETALDFLADNKEVVWGSAEMEELTASYPELFFLIGRDI